jgi:hypothetical protein
MKTMIKRVGIRPRNLPSKISFGFIGEERRTSNLPDKLLVSCTVDARGYETHQKKTMSPITARMKKIK